MKNEYLHVGTIIKIKLYRLNDRDLWTEIDASDFAKADEFPGTWVAKWNETARTFYARNNASFGWKTGYLHRYLLGVTDRAVQIDHRDHNGLNNRRYNLHRSDVKLNGFNRRGAEQGSISGFRNVYWNDREKKYMVWFVHNGQRYYFGYYSDPLIANEVAERERAKFL